MPMFPFVAFLIALFIRLRLDARLSIENYQVLLVPYTDNGLLHIHAGIGRRNPVLFIWYCRYQVVQNLLQLS